MLRKPIPSTNELLPVIGLGTWKAFDVPNPEPLRPIIEELSQVNGALIDSSPMYGRSEQIVGDLIALHRDRFFVATKVWTSGKQTGIQEMEASMRKMRAKPIDLMQVHNLLDVDVHLATLREWKAAGLVRYVGITHYTASAHAEVAKVIERHAVDFLQINYSASERDAERRLLPMAMERGIAVIANRPLATGDLPARLSRRPLPSLGGELEAKTWAELLLKFVVSHPAIVCAIPATSNLSHLRDNLRAGAGPMPDEAQRNRIVQAVSSA